MLTSITPLGERGRRRRWAPTAISYIVGSTSGGALIGLAAGTAGALVGSAFHPGSSLLAVLAAFACLLAALADATGRRLPTVHRQVNEDWLPAYRGWVCGLGFGVQLGMGVLTIVTTATVYLTAGLAVLAAAAASTPAGAIAVGMSVGSAFGLARALPILAGAGAGTPGQLAILGRRLAAYARPANQVTVALVAGAGLACVAVGAMA